LERTTEQITARLLAAFPGQTLHGSQNIEQIFNTLEG